MLGVGRCVWVVVVGSQGTLLGCETACVVSFFPAGFSVLFVVLGGWCGGVVCQLHSGREHLVSNFFAYVFKCMPFVGCVSWSVCVHVVFVQVVKGARLSLIHI